MCENNFGYNQITNFGVFRSFVFIARPKTLYTKNVINDQYPLTIDLAKTVIDHWTHAHEKCLFIGAKTIEIGVIIEGITNRLKSCGVVKVINGLIPQQKREKKFWDFSKKVKKYHLGNYSSLNSTSLCPSSHQWPGNKLHKIISTACSEQK